MKYLKTLILLAIILTKSVFSFDDEPAPAAEIFISNRSTTVDIFIKVIPIGFIFNGKTSIGTPFTKVYEYSSEASKPFTGKENHIFGGYKKLPKVIETFISETNGFFPIVGVRNGTIFPSPCCWSCDQQQTKSRF